MTLFVFGLGYAARAIVAAAGGVAIGTTRDGRGGTLAYDDAGAVRAGLAASARVLVSIPPDADGDPVLRDYADLLAGKWVGYLSSTGVYGDVGGAWVDESAPADRGRRAKRNAADAAWLARGAHVFRLPGIYGPGRSALERVTRGEAHRTGIGGQVFSRVHVDDIVAGVLAALDRPPADDGAEKAGGNRTPHALYNLGNSRAEALGDVIDTFEKACGVPAIRRMEPMQPGDVPATFADLTETTRDLGFRPRTGIAEGIPRFVDWYRQHGAAIDSGR